MVDQRDVRQQQPRLGSVKDYWPTIEQLADAPETSFRVYGKKEQERYCATVQAALGFIQEVPPIDRKQLG